MEHLCFCLDRKRDTRIELWPFTNKSCETMPRTCMLPMALVCTALLLLWISAHQTVCVSHINHIIVLSRCCSCSQGLLPRGSWCVCSGERGHSRHQRRLAQPGSHLRGTEAVHQRCADGKGLVWDDLLEVLVFCVRAVKYFDLLHSMRTAWRNFTSIRTLRCCCTWQGRSSNVENSTSASRCYWR